MTYMSGWNDYALSAALGSESELERRTAQEELYQRGRQDSDDSASKRIAVLEEACQFALSYFEAEWQQVDNHPASHLSDYVQVLQAALE